MNQTEIFNKLCSIITPFCKNEEALKNINKDSRFLEDLKINSARLVDIILDIEDVFNIEVDDESADKIHTMQDAITIISEKEDAKAS